MLGREELGRVCFSRHLGNLGRTVFQGSSTSKMSRKQTPSDFLKQIIGRPVVVKLNNGVDYRGKPDLSTCTCGQILYTAVSFSFRRPHAVQMIFFMLYCKLQNYKEVLLKVQNINLFNIIFKLIFILYNLCSLHDSNTEFLTLHKHWKINKLTVAFFVRSACLP